MEQIFPKKHSSSPEESFADLAEQRGSNWVYASSAATLNGKLGAEIRPYGGKGDWRWYNIMKNFADFIVVGGKTIRKSSITSDSRWQPGEATIVVVSASGNLPKESPLLQKQGRVVVYTEKSISTECLNQHLEIRQGEWDAQKIINDLGEGRKMIDGGGQIYSMFAPFVDDWMLTSVPVFSASNQNDLWTSQEELNLRLTWLWSEQNRLFARYTRDQI